MSENFNPEDVAVRLLREASDCPMAACRKAYRRARGDMNAALDLLRLWTRGVKVPATDVEIRVAFGRLATEELKEKLNADDMIALVKVLRELERLEKLS